MQTTKSVKICVIGSGGREHAICWKLNQSEYVEKIYVLPGNDGISQLDKVELVPGVDIKSNKNIATWCTQNNINLVIIGPEDPLANGLADELKNHDIKCFGPSQKGAQIESDKKWAKDFMRRYNIPTANYESFTDVDKAKNYIRNAPETALVIKANGLAAGKGVVVANNADEAIEAVDEILGTNKFGQAGDLIVVEEKLEGEEISVLAFVDSNSLSVMLPSQDHKRLCDNDEGPNTGGMGAYCPYPLVSKTVLKQIEVDILQRALDGFKQEGIDYCGVLYAGLMMTRKGPYVLEFNCRFGDPETQVILPMLKTDLYEVIAACCENRLSAVKLEWNEGLYAVGVVIASEKYPIGSIKDCPITGIPQNTEKLLAFHSGTKLNPTGQYVTNGGRVLLVVSVESDLKTAAATATSVCKGITFEGSKAQFRTDIAHKAFSFSLSYKDSGVDIDAGEALVERIKPLARGTNRSGVLGSIGGFGGLISLKELGYKSPVLCEVTRGIGAKLRLLLDHEVYENMGYDLIAMCVNDVLESGAEPIAILDYIACGKLQVPAAAQILKGVSDACRDSSCALLGGETAEMPSLYSVGEYDVAGYCLGVLEYGKELPKFELYEPGDLLMALPASGFHCTGFEMVFDIIRQSNLDSKMLLDNIPIEQHLWKPSTIYIKRMMPLIQKGLVKAISHVSSGLQKSIEKIIPDSYEVQIDAIDLPLSQLLAFLALEGGLEQKTLLNTFNCGIGLVFVVSAAHAKEIQIPEAIVLSKLQKSLGQSAVTVNNLMTRIHSIGKKLIVEPSQSLIELKPSTKLDAIKEQVNGMLMTIKLPEVYSTNGQKLLTRVPKTFHDPVLVIGTDGVGTKLKIAQKCDRHSTIGIDLVAMCINDILCNGAQPKTFLGYCVSGGSLTSYTDIAAGVVEGCKQARSSLIDMEIKEVPAIYQPETYDLAGFALGIAERKSLLPNVSAIKDGDIVIGLPSNGVHSNGFSLIHKIIDLVNGQMNMQLPFGITLGEELLKPTKIYVDAIEPLLKTNRIKALAHITGGGLLENIPRVLNKNLAVTLDARNFNIPPIFAWIAQNGHVMDTEMLRTFNCGLGLVIVAAPENESHLLNALQIPFKATKIGCVSQRNDLTSPQVTVKHFTKCLQLGQKAINQSRKRIAVLISGSGTNLQAIIDATRNTNVYLGAEVALVVSNKPDVYGLKRAAAVNIPSKVVSHKEFIAREDFDDAITQLLESYKIDVICLAGFMRILSRKFVKRWKGKLLNIHPSLLPKHPGLNVQQKALDAGDTESGCTVHFVDEGVDTGAIILQTKVPILPDDDCQALTDRIHAAEHYTYPLALKLVCTEIVQLNNEGTIVWAE